jgi:uncharacterized Rossmann fold enzyme
MQTLDAAEKQKVSYAVPMWVRDEQIKHANARADGWVRPQPVRPDPIAVVCYGPSLAQTWEQIRDFKFIISCSGGHKFLIERGIVPDWHMEVDPRAHKVKLIGPPHADVEYLIASTCHPAVFEHLKGFNVKLWHVYDATDEGMRTLPAGQYAITGGCSVGLRALTMARFLGFTNQHVFGMDGSEGETGKHAADHPNQAKASFQTVYNGKTYLTTPGFLEAARTTGHELDQMKDVRATFYGEGLVQAMMRDYVPKYPKGSQAIAFVKPELISPEYRALNAQLHETNLAYGVGGGKRAPIVLKLAESIKTHSILDYGCGRGYLAKEIPFPIWEYDPAIPHKSESPRPADLVVCTDVLEHIEPDKIGDVIADLRRCVKQIGYFVIHTGPAQKTLPDGRNTHLIQEGEAWWRAQLGHHFSVAKCWVVGKELQFLVVPKVWKKKKQAQVSALAAKAAAPQPIALSFGAVEFRREPYAIGATPNVLSEAHYTELAATFPMGLTLYRSFIGGDKKFSLSERNNPDAYHAFVNGSPAWSAFHAYIKSAPFADKVCRMLKAHKVATLDPTQLTARFEFSLLPADGGLLRAHTDITSKVVTLVIAMPTPEQPWEQTWGGGTDVLAQVDPTQHFDDYAAPQDALFKTHTFDYLANQCVVFVKSAQSWHSVGPVVGPEGQWRRTVTINLERAA